MKEIQLTSIETAALQYHSLQHHTSKCLQPHLYKVTLFVSYVHLILLLAYTAMFFLNEQT